jgi:DNA-directed RNA polymerase specialized sigma24 family protein
MEHSEGDPAPHDSDASLDGDVPYSDAHPAVAQDEPPQSGLALVPGISEKALRDLVAQPSTQESIRRIVGARVERGSSRALVDDLVQEATLAMLGAKARPRSMETASGWVSTVTVRTVANYFRRDEAHRTFVDPEADVEQQAGEPEEAPGDGWLIASWLAPILAHHPGDQETYELLVYKAHTGKQYKDVAAEHGLTTAALKSRVHEFKKKYEARWRRRKTMFVLLVLLAVAAAAIVAWLVLNRLASPAEEKRPAPLPVAPSAVPSATASAPDTPFEPAEPTRPAPNNGDKLRAPGGN